MHWLFAHMPVAGVEIFWPGLLILGFGAGVIGGFFGMGGAWMVTPGLNILGFPMAFAIGTDITHMAGKSLVSTMRHARFGNVDYKLGLVMMGGTAAGLEIAARMVLWLERLGKVDRYVRLGYLALLGTIDALVFTDVVRRRRKQRQALALGRPLHPAETGLDWHKRLHQLRLPPVLDFPRSGIRCSLWLPVAVSFATGWLAGILGIGGGLVRMPALLYLIGCPTRIAIGTDLFEVAVSGLYGAATYSYKGRTELTAALIMLVGGSVGAQIGAVATKYVKGDSIRVYFGVAVLGCGVSVLLKLLGSGATAGVVILALVAGLALLILYRFLRGVREELAARRVSSQAYNLGK
jgi:uncharacterized membrane protein YfcA